MTWPETTTRQAAGNSLERKDVHTSKNREPPAPFLWLLETSAFPKRVGGEKRKPAAPPRLSAAWPLSTFSRSSPDTGGSAESIDVTSHSVLKKGNKAALVKASSLRSFPEHPQQPLQLR